MHACIIYVIRVLCQEMAQERAALLSTAQHRACTVESLILETGCEQAWQAWQGFRAQLQAPSSRVSSSEVPDNAPAAGARVAGAVVQEAAV
jgi:hypothetical protein